MLTLLGLSGSLRQGSFNSALLRAAVELAPPGLSIELGTIRGIPIYDADLEEAQGVPEPVKALQARIAATDGLLIVTPEYNNSIPGPFKNAFDWLTRPPEAIGRVFGKRPAALMGATPGMGGTMLSQTAWLPVLRTVGLRVWFGPKVWISNAEQVFDAEGRLHDPAIRALVARALAGFAEFVTHVRK